MVNEYNRPMPGERKERGARFYRRRERMQFLLAILLPLLALLSGAAAAACRYGYF